MTKGLPNYAPVCGCGYSILGDRLHMTGEVVRPADTAVAVRRIRMMFPNGELLG
jgi:hypothetical protein